MDLSTVTFKYDPFGRRIEQPFGFFPILLRRTTPIPFRELSSLGPGVEELIFSLLYLNLRY